MKVTTSAKRRQSDTQAVTQVKLLSLVKIVRGPTRSKTWKATVNNRAIWVKVIGDLGGGLRAWHEWKWRHQGTWEIHCDLGLHGSSMQIERHKP